MKINYPHPHQHLLLAVLLLRKKKIHFWLCWVFAVVSRLSLVAESGGYPSLRGPSFSLQWLLVLLSTGSRTTAQQLRLTGLVALRHAESSQTRHQTCVPALAGRLSTPGPLRKPSSVLLSPVRGPRYLTVVWFVLPHI